MPKTIPRPIVKTPLGKISLLSPAYHCILYDQMAHCRLRNHRGSTMTDYSSLLRLVCLAVKHSLCHYGCFYGISKTHMNVTFVSLRWLYCSEATAPSLRRTHQDDCPPSGVTLAELATRIDKEMVSQGWLPPGPSSPSFLGLPTLSCTISYPGVAVSEL